MKLIEEIISKLSSQNESLTDALLKTKVLLHSLRQPELVAWVNSELNGYKDEEEIPDYRKVPAQVLADMSSITFQANKYPVPIGHLSKEERERLQISEMRQSLAVLEKFSITEGSLQNPIPLEANAKLGKSLASGVYIQKAWCQIETTSIVQILTEVRSRLLDFVLKLKEELPDEPSQAERESVDAISIFNNSVLGDNAVIIIGDKNKTNVINKHLKGNKEALIHELKKYQIPEEDIEQLLISIDEDEKSGIDHKSKTFGKAVKAWTQTMLHKAVETSWAIELGIASTVMTDALKHYYGWW